MERTRTRRSGSTISARTPHPRPASTDVQGARRTTGTSSFDIRRTRRRRRSGGRAERPRHPRAVPHPGPDHPPRAVRPGHHRPGEDRHGQDARLRPAHHPAPRPRPAAGRAGARRRADPRAVRPGGGGPRHGDGQPADAGRRDLRRQGLRGPDRAAEGGRADRGRHAGPPARPRRPAADQLRRDPRDGARRGGQDARPGLPARHREAVRADAGRAPHDAVLGHHAGCDRGAGATVHEPSGPHPRHEPGRGPDAGEHPAHRLPGALARQGRGHRPHPPGRWARQDRDLHAYQAGRRPTAGGAGRPRLRGRRRARRPGPGPAGARDGVVPQRARRTC